MSVAIVLGGGVQADGRPPLASRRPLAVIAQYGGFEWDRIILAGGICGNNQTGISEAAAQRKFLLAALSKDDQWISKRLILEDQSQNTFGNLLRTRLLLDSSSIYPQRIGRIDIVPTMNHSAFRVNFLAKKVFGRGNFRLRTDLVQFDWRRLVMELISYCFWRWKLLGFSPRNIMAAIGEDVCRYPTRTVKPKTKPPVKKA